MFYNCVSIISSGCVLSVLEVKIICFGCFVCRMWCSVRVFCYRFGVCGIGVVSVLVGVVVCSWFLLCVSSFGCMLVLLFCSFLI